MKCLACDKILTDHEATRRFSESKAFVDLCNHCFYSGVSDEVNFSERDDLADETDDLC
jgi:hypothetical protein